MHQSCWHPQHTAVLVFCFMNAYNARQVTHRTTDRSCRAVYHARNYATNSVQRTSRTRTDGRRDYELVATLVHLIIMQLNTRQHTNSHVGDGIDTQRMHTALAHMYVKFSGLQISDLFCAVCDVAATLVRTCTYCCMNGVTSVSHYNLCIGPTMEGAGRVNYDGRRTDNRTRYRTQAMLCNYAELRNR